MKKCDFIRDRLAEYAVGGLRGRVRARVEAHTRTCSECRAELRALERTGELLDAMDPQEAPAGTWEGVRERVTAPLAAQRRRETRGRPKLGWRPRWAWVMATAAVVLVLIVAVLLGPLGLGEPRLVVALEADEEMQATMEGHLSAVWAAPLSDVAALGLQMASVEENG